MGGVPVLSEKVLHQPTPQTRLPISHERSFALAAPAIESAFQEHGESLGPILRDVGLGAVPTQPALCATRNELHPKAREVLPPFDSLVSTPSPWLEVALHVATYAARFDEVLARAGSSSLQARIRSTSGTGAGHWLQATPILPSLR